jgi:ribosomal protein S18 acetylase RimI-like enzyme/uncharacterized protein YndB with AHSA1/START domain
VKKGSRELEVAVPAERVWELLVAPGLRSWYYRLAPQGTFDEGERIRWLGADGGPVEESKVVAVERGRRLELKSRFLFAPGLTALEPHRLEWLVTPSPGGSRVRLSWEAGDEVSAMMEAEGENMLVALRLAADPTLQAELARLDSIGQVDVRELTPARIPDYLQFFDQVAFRDYPAWRACYCHETHRTERDDGSRTSDENRRAMIGLIREGRVTALLAYEDEKPVAWCNYGETTALGGVMQRFKLQPADHAGVGSISCFIVAAPYRRHGIATRLLDAAVGRLRDRGVKTVEAYPAREEDSAQGNYRGALGMYLRAGFAPYREAGRNLIVRKTL